MSHVSDISTSGSAGLSGLWRTAPCELSFQLVPARWAQEAGTNVGDSRINPKVTGMNVASILDAHTLILSTGSKYEKLLDLQIPSHRTRE